MTVMYGKKKCCNLLKKECQIRKCVVIFVLLRPARNFPGSDPDLQVQMCRVVLVGFTLKQT